MLSGKKTYILGIGAILAAVGGFMTGAIDLTVAVQSVIAAIMGMTIRDGIAKK